LGYVGYKVPAQDFRLFAVAHVPVGAAHPWIVFDPIPRIDSVEPSNDSLLELCAAVYLLSGRRGRHYQRPPQVVPSVFAIWLTGWRISFS
jgi:hypothetical protein